jgi:hypothetical protein
LLARLRYNRLIDVFCGITCYSLQNHLRTQVAGGQIETDEVYVGIDKRGRHFIIPVQAKAGKDKINLVQIEQNMQMAAERFPNTICKPIAAQFMDDRIVLFSFESQEGEVRVADERHYMLVPSVELTSDELEAYLSRTDSA